ncbi:LacI family DNA-binding transcriptional regulator [Derxia gummosa]|uniref:LacI family DNA-binding transcriptional regulator n=1 Tax=Derxia gummosa DSM 723 TaxID=1121388 RepID=A0A8B6X9C1_9BURK|nr:LacI family DNA-binding transcriptional regulator [Derxia gummosa]
MARVTAQQVAESAGVSISAVSRTFTEGGSVSPETRARVEAAAAKLGYRPNQLARGLMTGRTRLVGVLLAGTPGAAESLALARVVEGLQAHSLHPLVTRIDATPGPAAALDVLLQYQVDAALIVGAELPDGFARDCQRAGIPALHLLGRKAARPAVPVVGADESAASAALVEKLVAGKRKRLACITDTPDAERVTAFTEAAGAVKGVSAAVTTVEAATVEAGRAAAARLLAAGKAPQALFCSDDRLALGALAACREAGLDVPGAVAIAGWGALGLDPALATVKPPVEAIVDDAIGRLVATLAGGGKLAGKRLQCELLPGATLG